VKAICPICGNELKLRKSIYGRFYGCSNYPKCKYITKSILVKKEDAFADNTSNIIKENSIVKLKNINTGEIEKYKIINPYVEYNSIFVKFGKHGPIYNKILKSIEGVDPSDEVNPTISIDSPIGKLLIGKSKGDIIEYGNDKYQIL